jgi:putative intracellular protease/amidase/YHS domain-containing protein
MKTILFASSLFIAMVSCKSKQGNEQVAENKSNTEKNTVLFPKPKVDIKTVGILLYDGYSTLDAMGPYQVLSEMMGVNVFFVGRTKGLIANGNGMKVLCDTSIAEVKQLDILVVPGGFKETYLAIKDTALINWIKAIDEHSKYTTSVCTGAWILGATGLLKDKEATTHWYGKKILAEQFGAKVQDKRVVKSGKYWTSAGVTAGMDMSLELINEITGENATKAAMLDLEYDPQPPFTGGNEQNTDKEIVETMRTLYDGGMESVLHPEKVFKNMKFDNTKDPICGMPIKAGISDTCHYQNKVYAFCSAGCKAEYLKNPNGYMVK